MFFFSGDVLVVLFLVLLVNCICFFFEGVGVVGFFVFRVLKLFLLNCLCSFLYLSFLVMVVFLLSIIFLYFIGFWFVFCCNFGVVGGSCFFYFVSLI